MPSSSDDRDFLRACTQAYLMKQVEMLSPIKSTKGRHVASWRISIVRDDSHLELL